MNLKSASKLFSFFLAVAINVCVAINIYSRLYPRNMRAVVIFVAGTLILWPILIWLSRKIIRRMKPLPLIDQYGTMLYRVKKGEVNFVGLIIKVRSLEEITIGNLSREYIYLRKVEEIRARKTFPFHSEIMGLEMKIEKISFIFSYERKDEKEMALKLFQYYGNQQRATALLKTIVNQAMQETFNETIKEDDNRRLIITADNYDLEEVFWEKLEAVMKKEKHPYALCNKEDAEFSFNICKLL